MDGVRPGHVLHTAFQHATLVLFPLVVIPHLVKYLGLDRYGMLAIGQAVAAIATVVVSYGFPIRGVVYVAQAKTDRFGLHNYLWTAIYLQLALFVGTALILVGIFSTFDQLRNLLTVLLACLLAPLGNAFFCPWLYQGLERFAINTAAIVGSRVFSFVLIISLVNNRDDLILAAVLVSIAPLLSALIGGAITPSDLRRPLKPQVHAVAAAFGQGWSAFTQQLIVALYGNVSTIMLGALTSPAAAGLYSVCERIINGCVSLLVPVYQVLFPRLAETYVRSKDAYLTALRGVFVRVAAASGVLFLVVTISSELLLSIFLSAADVTSAQSTFFALSWLILAAFAGPLLTQHLVIRERIGFLRTLVIVAALIHLALLFVLVPVTGAPGAAVATVAAQTMLLLSLILLLFSAKSDRYVH
jgi:PST family polysaccharide transporter